MATHLVTILVGGDSLKTNLKALSFLIGSGWNLAEMFFR